MQISIPPVMPPIERYYTLNIVILLLDTPIFQLLQVQIALYLEPYYTIHKISMFDINKSSNVVTTWSKP